MSALAAIGVQILMKCIGYNFVSRVLIIAAKQWAKSTKTHWDDQVSAALEEALK